MRCTLPASWALAAALLLPAIAQGEPAQPAPATAQQSQTQPQDKPARAMPEPPAELRDKLKVERVLVKGPGEKGIEIEVSYRIVDTENYASNPKTCFVADEESGKLVPLTKLAVLFSPAPAAEAMQQPPATLTLWDSEGTIRPGKPVTVVIAGFGQRHVVPEAGPGYDESVYHGTGIHTFVKPQAAADAELKILLAKVVADGHMLHVDYSSKGMDRLNADPVFTYVEESATGRRHPIVRVPRLGVLAPKDLKENPVSYMVIDNAGHVIKGGDTIAVSVNGIRREGVVVAPEAAKGGEPQAEQPASESASKTE